MTTVVLTNLEAVGTRITCKSGAVYKVAEDGTVTIDAKDVAELTALGYQLNPANPLRVPFLGYLATGSLQLPIGSCVVVANPTDPDTATFKLPAAALCAGSFYYIGYATGSSGNLAIETTNGDTVNGAASPGSTQGVYYSDGVNNFVLVAKA